MKIEPGQDLLHYRLVEQIGKGGMGVVWRARDTTLDRDVALKILPDAFSADANRLARFQREARLLASLNNPNIATIHGLHQLEQVHFLTMELLAGESLEARLARAGKLDAAEAWSIAVQVASALEVAHDQGIVHRDLKPANIQLLPDDTVKVLDFGLAKSLVAEAGHAGSGETSLPTMTSAGTVAGVVMGTPAYMSPEQARGKPVDRRTDVWAFGCVLYEMLTGTEVFSGETFSDTIARILERQPDLDKLPATVPPAIRQLLRRCLEKHRHKRLRHAGDALLVIEEVRDGRVETVEPSPTTDAAPGKARVLVAAAAMVGLVLGAVAMLALRPEPPPPEVLRYSIPVDDLPWSFTGSVALAPAGDRIAYVSDERLAVRQLDELEPLTIDTPEPVTGRRPFWSPDGRFVGYAIKERLMKVRADGSGNSETICTIPETGEILDAVWGPDNRIVFNVWRGSMYEASAEGGTPKLLFEADHETIVDFHRIDLLPDGTPIFDTHYASAEAGQRGIMALVDGKLRMLLAGDEYMNPTYSPSGHLLFNIMSDDQLVMAVPFSAKTKELTGEPFRVATLGIAPAVAIDGTLAYVTILGDQTPSYQLFWLNPNGEIGAAVGEPGRTMWAPRISPDGSQAVMSLNVNDEQDLWVTDLASGARRRLTFQAETDWQDDERGARWSADGRDIVFSRDANLRRNLFALASDGSGKERALFEGGAVNFAPDGRSIAYTVHELDGDNDLFRVELGAKNSIDSAGEPVALLQTDAIEDSAAISPDGRYLVYRSGDSEDRDIFLTQYPSGAGRWQVSFGGGNGPRWSSAGDKIFFVNDDDELFEATVTVDPAVRIGTPRKVTVDSPGIRLDRGYDVADDGRLLVMRELPGSPGDQKLAIVIVRNWLEASAAR